MKTTNSKQSAVSSYRLMSVLVRVLSVIVCVSSLTSSAWPTKKKETPTPAILKEYPFTMTKKEYDKATKGAKPLVTPEKIYLCIPYKFMGSMAVLCFRPKKNNGLQEIKVHVPLKKEKNPRKYVREYEKIKRLLIKKYGLPVSDKSEYNKNVSIKKYKRKLSGKELALSDGNLQYISQWKTDKFIMELKCYKDNRGRTSSSCVCIDLSYFPPKNGSIPAIASTEKKSPLDEL